MANLSSAMLSVVIGLVQVAVILGCTCDIKHPQTQYKEADFVVKAKILSKQRGQEGPEFSPPSIIGYTEYQVKVDRIFKGRKYFNQSMVAIFTPDGSCGMRSMRAGRKYVISGHYADRSYYLNVCSWVAEWSKLTKEQKMGLKSTYAAKCRKCTVPSVSGPELVMNIFGDGTAPEALTEQHLTSLSGLWTAEPGSCTFNPVDSWQYVEEAGDCESMYTYCVKKEGDTSTSSQSSSSSSARTTSTDCGWQINNVYKNCFIDRETAWAKEEIERSSLSSLSSGLSGRSMRGRFIRVGSMQLRCSGAGRPTGAFDRCLRREVARFVTRYLPGSN